MLTVGPGLWFRCGLEILDVYNGLLGEPLTFEKFVEGDAEELAIDKVIPGRSL